MRFLRLRLANYRGIDESEVRFGPQGLTIVEGPNEAGKTSLSEAIRLLFDYFDSSTHGNIKAIKPVMRDVGPEVELEAESGPYVFTYFKRFHKKPETTLTITNPKPENHTGREAHERAKEILRQTIDMDLWRALSIQQGEAIQQADLSKQTSLSAALDIAAGGHRADPREEGLFDKVQEEYRHYFTERGSEKKELQEARKAQEEKEAELTSLKEQIQHLEKDIVRAAELSRELERLKKQEQDIRGDVSSYTESLDKIKGLETALETARLKLESAQKSEQAARRDKEVRQDLIDAVSKAEKAHAELDESITSSTALVKKAEDNLEKAQLAATEGEARRKKAESLLKLRRADFDYFNDKLHLEQLKERKDRIDRAREATALADELLAENSVNEEALKTIQKAERLLITAQAKLETGAPNVLLRGLADFDFQIDGQQTTISKDEEFSLSVSDRVRVTIPGSLEMEVTAGSSSSDLSKTVEEAKRKLDAVCNDAGVNNADEARHSYDARREALQSIAKQKEIEKENLRDLTHEELERKVIGLGKGVPAYPASRISEPKLPENLEAANKELRIAEGDLEDANKAWEEARTELDAARKVRDGLRERHQKVKVELDLKAEELNRLRDELVRSRKITSDDDLELAHSKFTRIVHTEEENVKSAETDLSDKEPDRVKALAETAKGSLETVEKKREAAQKENTEVRTRLKIFGEEGLHEKLHAAQSHLDHIRQENAAMNRRAQAARLLYVTMKEERDKARRAYVAPLKERIERLGRLVFNDSLEVEVTENLSIASRTLDGFTVPFDSLSGGTREQLSLISRLACAMIVSKDGGAFLILDDALGYTDPERLKLMGAVLAKAAKECQIIILTCVPDRYNNIGEATVVRLA
ncbi:AAA family ATPase [Thermodesulfovibrionales bacterium]|nr:AAA family ATPase [Thermodesulfovibrionales bacterium]